MWSGSSTCRLPRVHVVQRRSLHVYHPPQLLRPCTVSISCTFPHEGYHSLEGGTAVLHGATTNVRSVVHTRTNAETGSSCPTPAPHLQHTRTNAKDRYGNMGPHTSASWRVPPRCCSVPLLYSHIHCAFRLRLTQHRTVTCPQTGWTSSSWWEPPRCCWAPWRWRTARWRRATAPRAPPALARRCRCWRRTLPSRWAGRWLPRRSSRRWCGGCTARG